MTQAEAEFIAEAMGEIGEECEIREEYSGRGMMGKTTYGLVVDNVANIIPAVISAAWELGIQSEHIPEEFHSCRGYSIDSMGLQTIIY